MVEAALIYIVIVDTVAIAFGIYGYIAAKKANWDINK